ncbi:hypothetical protein TSA1_25245 [Bradyrhizobium nitroreducens]|uniref:Uncharacterized protein n=1 Tax=Bradyrhizobium nitroreducens TaxID=709803 RepID=A0A2M6UGM3_9BRAD|nr:hypothetical protein TSA1_25245 [Bradyrhizobium nitroreducens]
MVLSHRIAEAAAYSVIASNGNRALSCPGRSAALLQRCAAEPGPMLPSDPLTIRVAALRGKANALHRVQDTRVG